MSEGGGENVYVLLRYKDDAKRSMKKYIKTWFFNKEY